MKHYYAASLKGTNPGAIENVFSFENYSQRKQWLTEKHHPEGERISLRANIAKKHLMLPVTFRDAVRMGSKCWTWFYNDIPSWLS